MPKQIDGINTTLKQMKALGVDIPLRLMSLEQKAKGAIIARGSMIEELLLPAKKD